MMLKTNSAHPPSEAEALRPGPGEVRMQSWEQWKREVVVLLQIEFRELLNDLTLDDVDWCAWQPLYVQGRSARDAIDRALERDL